MEELYSEFAKVHGLRGLAEDTAARAESAVDAAKGAKRIDDPAVREAARQVWRNTNGRG
jgi:hypothetical protein